jgi:hypothetical protein
MRFPGRANCRVPFQLGKILLTPRMRKSTTGMVAAHWWRRGALSPVSLTYLINSIRIVVLNNQSAEQFV